MEDEEQTLDAFVGPWSIWQLKRGHRFSVDDLVTAWMAAKARPDVKRVLDLGCGIGSVGMATLWRLGHPDATLVGVEAQEVSVALFRKSIATNGLGGRVDVYLGDMREAATFPSDERFELITGSPPYIPPGKGLLSPHPQRAHCRIELRGGVDVYCEAAAPRLAPGGRFVFVMAAADERTERAPREAGLSVVERLDVVFRDGREPLIAVLVCALTSEVGPTPERVSTRLIVRDVDGDQTAEYAAFRQDMGGLGPGATARNASREAQGKPLSDA